MKNLGLRLKKIRKQVGCSQDEFAQKLGITKQAISNDTILLSPATASYDQYSSYVERGKHFDSLVKEYIRTVENENKTKKK